MPKAKKKSQHLDETQIYVRCTSMMKARIAKAVENRSKRGTPTTEAHLVRELLDTGLSLEGA